MVYRKNSDNPPKNIKLLVILLYGFQVARGIVPPLITLDGENELPNKLRTNNYRHIGQYKILTPESRCKISYCHDSTTDTKNYHSYCFQEQCAYESFHCINESGNVIIFCAQFVDCKLRYRHIAVLNKQRPGYVDIYEIHCEVGFFQRNDRHSCFTPCAKDTSITLIEPSGANSAKLAFCKLGCNPYGKMLFELDSEYDNCTGSNQCQPSLDRLPDCSCAEPCPPNFERYPKNNFSCSSRNESTNDEATVPADGESSRPKTTVADEVEEKPPISVTDEVEGDKTEDTIQDHSDKETDDIVSLEEKINNVEESNSSSNDYANVWIPIVAIISIIAVVAMTMAKTFRKWRSNHYTPVNRQTDPEAHEGRSRSGTKRTTTINDNSTVNNFTFNNRTKVEIHTGSHTTENKPDTDIESIATQQEEPLMDLLEEPVLIGGDASMTHPKQLFS